MIRFVFGLLACSATISFAQRSPQNCERIQVGAWSMQWLGNARAGKRMPQAPRDIASIRTSRVDILAPDEISVNRTTAEGKPRNSELDAALASLDGPGAQWQYDVFEKRAGARAPDDQWAGIAWNAAAVTSQLLSATTTTEFDGALEQSP